MKTEAAKTITALKRAVARAEARLENAELDGTRATKAAASQAVKEARRALSTFQLKNGF